MDLFSNLALGFSVAVTLNNLMYCGIGVLLGTAIGVLPGVGPLITIAVLLPLTFGLPPEGSLIMLAGIYYGAQYGGSTTAILVNLPGETSSVVTCIDGHQMARQGRAGPALAIAALGSLFAGLVGTILIALFGPPMSALALRIHSPEYFALAVMALCGVSALVHGSPVKGLAMAMVGVFFGTIGIDVNTGVARFTFGIPGLLDGIEFAVAAMGLFAIAEIITNLNQRETSKTETVKVTSLMPTWADIRQSWGAVLRGTTVGSVFGILPGTGAGISSFAAYMLERKWSKTPERFGKGAIEGVASPEAANNAAAQTSFIPTLTLGIPGSATMALMLGALMIQGITPGPRMATQHPELFWGLIASMVIGNILLVILNLPLIGMWVQILKAPYRWLYPAILVFSCVGVYSLARSPLDVFIAGGFGLAGWMLAKFGCEPAPLVLGFVLGPLLEENMRRSLILSHGDPLIFVTRPLSATFLLVALVVLLAMIAPSIRRQRDIAVQ